MTRADLDHLVRLARRERAPAAALEAIAHRLRVPFVVAPVAAVMLPSSAFAVGLAKLGVTRSWLLGWGAGSAAVVAGGIAALTLATPRPSAIDAPKPTERAVVVSAPASARPPAVLPAQQPEPAPLATSAEREKPRDAPATWDEPQLIERARKALGTDPQRALALTQEYQRRFPGGALAVEREVIALEALARLGRSAEARRRALAFEARHPSSIHLPRVRALLSKLDAP